MADTDVIVVGGGIAGLGAAHTLQKQGFDVVVLEREPVAGGRMRSVQVWDEDWVDVGAEQLTSADQAFLDIVDEFGLNDQVIGFLSDTGTAFPIRRDGRVYEFDIARPRKLLTYGAMSAKGKAQLVRLLPAMVGQMRRNNGTTFEPWRAGPVDDESVEEWLGRLAPEFLEYAMEPLWDIVCGWDPADISRGFLLYTMTAYRNATGFTLTQGVGSLTRALASVLDVRTGQSVTRIDVAQRSVEVEDFATGRSECLNAEAVLVAVPGNEVSPVVDGIDEQRRGFFESVRYQAHDNCFFKLRDDEAGERLGQLGFFPRKEHGELNAVGFDKLPTNPDKRVFRAGLKGRFSTQFVGRSDEELEAAIMARVAQVAPEIPPLIEDRQLCRWESAIPLFPVGYLRELAAFHALTPMPGVAFAGDYLAMPSTGAAHDSGQRAAAELMEGLRGRR